MEFEFSMIATYMCNVYRMMCVLWVRESELYLFTHEDLKIALCGSGASSNDGYYDDDDDVQVFNIYNFDLIFSTHLFYFIIHEWIRAILYKALRVFKYTLVGVGGGGGGGGGVTIVARTFQLSNRFNKSVYTSARWMCECGKLIYYRFEVFEQT